MTNDDELIGYLAGDGEGQLDPDDRAELDELRALLADPSVWAEPGPHVEDAVVAAVTDAATNQPRPTRQISRRPLVLVLGGAVAAAVMVAFALVAFQGGDDRPTFEAALGSDGTVTITKFPSGWKVALDTPTLPRLDGGQYYQAWLKRADGTLVPVGSFNEGDDVVLWAGVSPADFPQFTVTVEAADGNQASSGQRVLAGDLHQTK